MFHAAIGAVVYSVVACDWLVRTIKTEGKLNIFFGPIYDGCKDKLYSFCNVQTIYKWSFTLVSECDNPEHKTHAFDVNGAFSAYLSVMLFLMYCIDTRLKYKELHLIRSFQDSSENLKGNSKSVMLLSFVSIFDIRL